MEQYISCKNIINEIEGIQKGDILYIVSDILQLSIASKEHKERFDMNAFIDSILEKVGLEGTVLIPTFNWDFCKGVTFDIRKTISRTGALGNAAIKRTDFKRTKHPLYSFMVWGKDKEELTSMDPKDGFGKGTIFEYMHRNHAKALVVGLPTLYGLTFCHYVEAVVGVPYRYMKDFTAGYIDEDGVETQKTYSMYVRDLERNPTYIDGFRPLGDILERLNVSTTQYVNDAEFHMVDLENAFEIIKMDITLNDSGNMYHYNHI